MSELINGCGRTAFRGQFLATASALALAACIAATDTAKAEDTDRPTVWIELGGQMEMSQGMTSPFTAPFMSITPTPEVYQGVSFTDSQKSARFTIGGEGKITIQPEDSDWKFSAAIRYGRSNATRHKHSQSLAAPIRFDGSFSYTYAGQQYHQTYIYTKQFETARIADTETHNSEQHVVLDFVAGKDVGLGLLGRHDLSTISAGVRFASFTSQSKALITARPEVLPFTQIIHTSFNGNRPFLLASFHQYTMVASATRSFRGIGPTVSWDASTTLLGHEDSAKLTFDWGVNAAALFGRQKAKIDHSTHSYKEMQGNFAPTPYASLYNHVEHTARSRSVAVPNLGGFAGLSVRYPNAKVSFGYRADFFFGAMDTGIDERHTKDVGFSGPYASISVGL
ncbi:MAG TPA: hypothetical protein VMS78_17025 [Rhizomicrobium sp.]|nr:hypothetical protein [Rhizomicrobium sp.]